MMKRFILKRIMQYTEILEVEAETWNAAKEILQSDTEFEVVHDDQKVDESIEFIGDI